MNVSASEDASMSGRGDVTKRQSTDVYLPCQKPKLVRSDNMHFQSSHFLDSEAVSGVCMTPAHQLPT